MMKRYIVFPFLFMFLASCSNVVVKKNYPLRLPQKIVLKNSNIMQKKATQKPVSPVISHSPAQNVPSPVENAYINRHVSKKISQSKEIETVRAGKKIQLTLENIPLNKKEMLRKSSKKQILVYLAFILIRILYYLLYNF